MLISWFEGFFLRFRGGRVSLLLLFFVLYLIAIIYLVILLFIIITHVVIVNIMYINIVMAKLLPVVKSLLIVFLCIV